MPQTRTSVLSNQASGDYDVFPAADLDVWVAYDGGTIIVVQGTAGSTPGLGSSLGDPHIPAEASAPDATVIDIPAVTREDADGFPTIIPLISISIPPTLSQLTINPPPGLPTFISETQARSTRISWPSSETPRSTLSNLITPSLSSQSLPATTPLVPTSPSSSAVTSAEPTISVAPPTPSDYLSHSPPYYIAIVLGSIAGVATLTALIAWAFRRHARAKRRRLAESASQLPWVYSGGTDDDGRSAASTVTPDVEYGMRNTDTQLGITKEDMAYVQAWEPRGDRDVGEPKRSEHSTDRKTRPPFLAQQIPSFQLFSRSSAGDFMRETRISAGSIDPQLHVDTLGKGSTLLITNQVPGDISVCSSQEAGFPFQARGSGSPHSSIGTPREIVPTPRFLALDGGGLNIPREEKPYSTFATITDELLQSKTRSRIMSAEHIRKTWDRTWSSSNDHPGNTTNKSRNQGPDGEGWASSLRSNFVNALNAVAANLPIATAASKSDDMGHSDNLTPVRLRRSIKDKELLRQHRSSSSLDRKDTINSLASNPWSLVETGSNTGIVNIHIPTSDTDSISSHGTSDRLAAVGTRDVALRNHEPLQIKKKLSLTPLSKRRSPSLCKDSRSRVVISPSPSSVSPSKRHKKASSCGGSVKRMVTIDRRSSPVYSRTTSMASILSTTSAVSIVSGTDDVTETGSVLKEALRDRRRKAKKLKDSVSG